MSTLIREGVSLVRRSGIILCQKTRPWDSPGVAISIFYPFIDPLYFELTDMLKSLPSRETASASSLQWSCLLLFSLKSPVGSFLARRNHHPLMTQLRSLLQSKYKWQFPILDLLSFSVIKIYSYQHLTVIRYLMLFESLFSLSIWYSIPHSLGHLAT